MSVGAFVERHSAPLAGAASGLYLLGLAGTYFLASRAELWRDEGAVLWPVCAAAWVGLQIVLTRESAWRGRDALALAIASLPWALAALRIALAGHGMRELAWPTPALARAMVSATLATRFHVLVYGVSASAMLFAQVSVLHRGPAGSLRARAVLLASVGLTILSAIVDFGPPAARWMISPVILSGAALLSPRREAEPDVHRLASAALFALVAALISMAPHGPECGDVIRALAAPEPPSATPVFPPAWATRLSPPYFTLAGAVLSFASAALLVRPPRARLAQALRSAWPVVIAASVHGLAFIAARGAVESVRWSPVPDAISLADLPSPAPARLAVAFLPADDVAIPAIAPDVALAPDRRMRWERLRQVLAPLVRRGARSVTLVGLDVASSLRDPARCRCRLLGAPAVPQLGALEVRLAESMTPASVPAGEAICAPGTGARVGTEAGARVLRAGDVVGLRPSVEATFEQVLASARALNRCGLVPTLLVPP